MAHEVRVSNLSSITKLNGTDHTVQIYIVRQSHDRLTKTTTVKNNRGLFTKCLHSTDAVGWAAGRASGL